VSGGGAGAEYRRVLALLAMEDDGRRLVPAIGGGGGWELGSCRVARWGLEREREETAGRGGKRSDDFGKQRTPSC
jgi:hypothetical protein